MKLSDIEKLNAAIRARRPTALATWVKNGHQELLPHPDLGDAAVRSAELTDTLRDRFRTDRSGMSEIAGEDVFIRIYNPALQMIIIGAVHIAQALIPTAKALCYAPIVIDPRTAFNSEERFADVPRDTRWPDEALADLPVDTRTAFIALTHDPKIDDPALEIALAGNPFYIGALGSRRTHASRLERLSAKGIPTDQLACIHAPIGLDIGAVGAPEIAVAIIAEVTAALRGKKTLPESA
jgi:xanthine dehydrogenase accessory factor